MNVVCVGGGPAGLYFALLMRLQDPAHHVTVLERHKAGDTFGWGVVFSDQTLGNLQAADAKSAGQILSAFNHWDDIEIRLRGQAVRSGGHGFCGIARRRLLDILQARCAEAGVVLRFETEVGDDDEVRLWREADLVVAGDGANSRLRARHAASFEPAVELRENRFVWLGTTQRFEAFTFAFEETPWGWFQAHAYRFDEHTSTFIVETPERVWRAAGLADMGKEEAIAFCERLFARHLDGHRLISNAAHLRGSAQWLRFPRVACARWVHAEPGRAPLVLAGDAAHTAHFSVGSGTKLALEDAIELARQIGRHGRAALPLALADYEAIRKVEVARLQNAARNSTEWFEHVDRYVGLPLEQFAYSLLTRSQRISHENLRLRDAGYVAGFERWHARRAGVDLAMPDAAEAGPYSAHAGRTATCSGATGADATGPTAPGPGATGRGATGPGATAANARAATAAFAAPPPMFTPFRARSVTLKNRVVVSPMAQYRCEDGAPGDWHLVHLGARALGGAGLVMVEMTCPSPDARITLGCPGLWNDAQQAAWARIVGFVHRESDARIGLQLGHAGAKGATLRPWEGEDDAPLPPHLRWPLVSASPQQYAQGLSDRSRAATLEDLARIREQFVAATRRAAEAGFDWLELHCAHGYLLSSFLSPLTNRRDDAYGGPLGNRLRYPLEVFAALRAAWPQKLPISVRISAHDWAPGGTTPDDAVEIARAFKAAGADLIDCSSGQVSRDQQPVYGRMYQTPLADRIRNEAGIATIAVGAITEGDQVNGILAAGRADLCAIARPHLANPAWTLTEAARLGVQAIDWPAPYRTAKPQLERLLGPAARGPGGQAAP